MNYTSIVIEGKNVTKEILDKHTLFYRPYNSFISKLQDDTYHMPFMSGPHTIEAALEWCNKQYCFCLNFETRDEAIEVLKLPELKDAYLEHKFTKTNHIGNDPIACSCCTIILGYGRVSVYPEDFLCIACKRHVSEVS